MKIVRAEAHSFDSLPAHISVVARGEGGTVKAALRDAISSVFDDHKLKHKRIKNFKLSVHVSESEKDETAKSFLGGA